ncbi:hypothetical protein CDIK_3801 [Cucumispora dikerogammari]|nr:hypothetical protein CDIK_3801 [Cucumispora dikerogammari]
MPIIIIITAIVQHSKAEVELKIKPSCPESVVSFTNLESERQTEDVYCNTDTCSSLLDPLREITSLNPEIEMKEIRKLPEEDRLLSPIERIIPIDYSIFQQKGRTTRFIQAVWGRHFFKIFIPAVGFFYFVAIGLTARLLLDRFQ